MKRLLILMAGVAFSLPASAVTEAAACAEARDPVRCEARQAATKSCAGKRGAERRRCVEAGIPPADCGKAQNPQACLALQKAEAACQGKIGKERKKCLRDERPRRNKARE